jgi:hypothetical protein
MPEYELTFELPSITEAVEDQIVDATEATIAEHFGVSTATVLIAAPDAVSAAREVIEELSRAGAVPMRLVDDLVSRSQIAERAGVTRQAVTNWVNGSRQAGTDFPKPFVLTSGGLWRWDEVLYALRAMGLAVDDDATYPTRRESQLIGGMIASRQFELDRSVVVTAFAEHFGVAAHGSRPTVAMKAPLSAKADFALGA